ncbi:MAG: DUF3618 domain-containing protein [Actinomycetota bacterium]|nr:DUF3618 domain-containing protein [Actinomycetota bacterium]
MAGSTDSIERDIERARDSLASTLDELATRTNPKRLLEQAKTKIAASLAEPKVKAALAGVAGLVLVVVVARARR